MEILPEDVVPLCWLSANAVQLITATFGALILVIIWGAESGVVLTFATTTLLGVVLFASWSISSNVTACFILLPGKPVLINPRERLDGVGELDPFEKPQQPEKA